MLAAINPLYAAEFIISHPLMSFFALGSVVLAVTGGEALYTDMGHFGRLPIRLAWFGLVLPALLLNYFGQGALLIDDPTAIQNPFFRMGPEWMVVPMVVLATCATVIASQAVISGAFSVARQAIQLGLLPRMTIVHTSGDEEGQIYVPFTNWTLYVAVMALVIGFQSSSNLAAAYGIAVTGTMMIDTILVAFVMALLWRWPLALVIAVAGTLLLVDLAFFTANVIKVAQGGWFPLFIGIVSFTVLTTWRRGRELVRNQIKKLAVPLDVVMRALGPDVVPRPRHRDLPHRRDRRRAAGAAAQPQAQSDGAPARGPGHRDDHRSALRAGRRPHRTDRTRQRLLSAADPLRLHADARHPRRARRLQAARARVQHDVDLVLPQPGDLSCRASIPAWRCGASGCSPS